ncbi:1-acyl-sn-glycerol-3-phosphate acyltransferase [Pannus brasiliensis CCIBt3594]|uniref:1-acyl-sn-glycerol-3-phosphate acyltransferase n=1 Tax=Pannus brasiliensis CCIBt3594 TaxID=1427578 RepID=A0AAW9QSX8_9CHRO
MPNLSTGARPPLEFIPPDLDFLVLRGVQTLLPLWLRTRTNLRQIEADRLEILVDLYQRFQAGKIRLFLAFRHPSVNDPFCMGYLMGKLLPEKARELGIPLKTPVHAHFIYDRGIPLWAGSAVGWLYAKLGGTPIQRGKNDLMGLRSARKLLLEADFPLAAAPEGATNGHNEIVSPIEPGISQLAFWCVDDLRKAGRDEEVYILPIGLQYFYLAPVWSEIEQILANIESDVGCPAPDRSIAEKNLYDRLFRLGEKLLSLMEDFYRDFYGRSLPIIPLNENDPNETLSRRLSNLLDAALQIAEEYFHVPASGTVIDRCRRLEQAAWDRIYRDELKPGHSLSPVESALADRVADESNLRIWHMRIVESFVAVTGYYVKEKPTIDRFAETILLLWDLVTRIKGGNPFFRPKIGRQKAKITIGEPISITDRYAEYKSDRRAAVTRLTADLQASLESSIDRQ